MAENKSSAQHLASLDLEISGILESLKKADEQIQEYGKAAGKNFNSAFSEGLGSTSQDTPEPLKSDPIKSTTEAVTKLNTEYGKLAKTVQTLDAAGTTLSKRETYITDSQVQTVLRYNGALEQTGKTITDNAAKREADQKKAESQIDKMIQKQKAFNATVSAQRGSSTNTKILSDSDNVIKKLDALKKEIENTGYVTDQQRKKLSDYGEEITDIGNRYQEAGTKGESFLEKISDKAKWLAAFYVVNELKNGFFDTIEIIKSTEDAVVDLQRVLSDDVGQSKMSEELYDVAYQYGRTFDEVAEVSTRFAEAGYDWNDTMELTKGTMLALNTAELDVTQSTNDLIAVMSQWNLTAEDYADLIDKINITADKFPVTSENIVAALQRASSTAKNANFSLEQTIGIITALAEATGRSGENIGTALNSLILYTSKAKSLETFASVGSEAMKQVVADYQMGAASIYDVWKQLSVEIKDLSKEQQEALFKGEDYQELATELKSALGDVYGTAGVYRQNYFIALLNDISTAEDAINGMSEAQGYSINENEKYMASLTAAWNQLKAALAELAVQLGNDGLLDFLKFLTGVATAATKATQAIGGLTPILTTVAGIFITIKQQKIADTFSEISSGFKYLSQEASVAIAQISAAPGVLGKANAAMSLLSGGTMTLAGVFGIATAAIGVLLGAYSSISNAIEQQKQQARESASANLEQAKSLDELKQKYIEIMDSTATEAEKDEQLAEIKDTLAGQYGIEREALEKLNDEREYGISLLEEESKKDITEAYSDIASQYNEARKKMEQSYRGFTVTTGLFGMDQGTLDMLEQYGVILDKMDASGGPVQYSFDIAGDGLKEQLATLKEANAALQAQGIIIPELEDRIKELNDVVEDNSKAYDEGTEITAEYFVKVNDAYNDLRDNVSDVSSLEDFRDALVEAADGNQDLIDAIDDILANEYPEFASQSEEFSDTLDETTINTEYFTESIQSLTDELASFQSAYATVTAALDEYNQTGQLSIQTIESIISLGPGYITMLESVDGKLRLNEEAVGNLINAQKENVAQMIQQSLASDTLKIAQEYLTTATDDTAQAQKDAKTDSDNLEQSISGLSGRYLEASASASLFASSVAGALGPENFGENLQNFKNEVQQVYESYQGIYDQIRNIAPSDKDYWTGATKSAKSAGSAAKSTKSEAEKAAEEVQKLIDKLNDLRRQREEAAVSLTSPDAIKDNDELLTQINNLITGLQNGTISAEEATDALKSFDDIVSQIKIEEDTYKKLVDEQKQLAEDEIQIQDMLLDKEKDRLEKEKDAIDERYDYEEERAEKLSDVLDEIKDTYDYLNNRSSIITDIRKAQVRSGVEYREAEMEAKNNLAQLDIERFFTLIQNSLDGQSDKINSAREEQLKGVEDKIQAVEDQAQNLSDIKSLLSNQQVNFYDRFGGDLSNLADKVGNVDEFLKSIGYAVVVDTPATSDVTDQTMTDISEAVYTGTELTQMSVEGILQNFATVFMQSINASVSDALGNGMSGLSSVIASAIASSIASAGGYTSNNTTNTNVTNVIGSIASVAGSYAAQNLVSLLFKP